MDKPLLQIDRVSFSYGATPVLNGISFDVEPGSYVALIGPNGSGKTTLFRLLSGQIAPHTGRALLTDREVASIPIPERARMLAMVSQKQSIAFPFTCLEAILMGLTPHRARFEPIKDTHLSLARDLMEQTDVWRFAQRPVTALSGGELQRVLLTRALLQRPKLLLLDEAISELDIAAGMAMVKLLKRHILETGMTVISIHHDLSLAYRYADRVIALHSGKIAADSPPEEAFTEELFRKVFLVEAELIEGKGFLLRDHI